MPNVGKKFHNMRLSKSTQKDLEENRKYNRELMARATIVQKARKALTRKAYKLSKKNDKEYIKNWDEASRF